jgi:hypothetical protein
MSERPESSKTKIPRKTPARRRVKPEEADSVAASLADGWDQDDLKLKVTRARIENEKKLVEAKVVNDKRMVRARIKDAERRTFAEMSGLERRDKTTQVERYFWMAMAALGLIVSIGIAFATAGDGAWEYRVSPAAGLLLVGGSGFQLWSINRSRH